MRTCSSSDGGARIRGANAGGIGSVSDGFVIDASVKVLSVVEDK